MSDARVPGVTAHAKEVLHLAVALPWHSSSGALGHSSGTMCNTRSIALKEVSAPGHHPVAYTHGDRVTAYTLYALFEWSLVVYDVTFDSIAGTEARHLQVSASQSLATVATDHQSSQDPDPGRHSREGSRCFYRCSWRSTVRTSE